jgi:inosine-uridine nucleoside N-ribohydrolase
MQFQQGKPPIGVVFDSAMGSSIDDALALGMLFGLQGKSECRVTSVSVTKCNLKAAAFADALVRFYTGPPGPFGSAYMAIGMATTGLMPEDTPMLNVPLARMDAEGKPLYGRGIVKLNDTADTSALIRNALSAQYDDNALVVLTGPATNLAKVLDLPGARELIARKVRLLAVDAGDFAGGSGDTHAEPHIKADIASARRLLAEWPTPIVAAGAEVGAALQFPAASLEKEFSWSPNHPVVDAYRAYHTLPYDAPSGAMAAGLYAVRPDAGYFKLSGPGAIQVLDDGRTRFQPSAGGKHRYLIADPEQKDKILAAYTELASTKPVPRAPRFRGVQKKQADEKKQQ